MAKMKIKKGDTVQVLTGKDKAKQGKVIAVDTETQRVTVEGVNRVTRHVKPGPQGTGGLVVQEAPIHVSNVAIVDPVTRSPPGQDPRRAGRARRPHQDHPCAGFRALRQGHLMTETATKPRLKTRYAKTQIRSTLSEQFSYGNAMQVPGVVKVVVNMGVGDAAKDSKLIEGAIRDLAAITGQKPQVTKARKSIAQFKLREGMPIGATRHAARRPHVGVPRPSGQHCAAAYP
jgi:ribosomal protein L24